MNLNDYQLEAGATAEYTDDDAIIYLSLGIASEAGEVAGKIKKLLLAGREELTDAEATSVALEIGDVLWYVARLSHALGFELNTVARMNLLKLRERKRLGKIQGDGDER